MLSQRLKKLLAGMANQFIPIEEMEKAGYGKSRGVRYRRVGQDLHALNVSEGVCSPSGLLPWCTVIPAALFNS